MSQPHNLVEAIRDVAEPLVVTHIFALSNCRERVTTHCHGLHRAVHHVTASKVDTHDRVREREAIVDGDRVRETNARAEDNTRRTTQRVQGQTACIESDIASVLNVSSRVTFRMNSHATVVRV